MTELVYWHDCEILPEIRAVRRAASKVGTALFPLLLEVKRADLAAQSDYQRLKRRNGLTGLTAFMNRFKRRETASRLRTWR